MFKKNILLPLFLVVFVFAGSTNAQQPAPPGVATGGQNKPTKIIQLPSIKDLSQNEKFSSIEAGFSINLPSVSKHYLKNSQSGQLNVIVERYEWLFREGSISVQHLEFPDPRIDCGRAEIFDTLVRGARDGYLSVRKGRVISGEFGKSGLTQIYKYSFQLEDGKNGIGRSYCVNKTVYSLMALESEENAIGSLAKAVDSFSILIQPNGNEKPEN